MFFRRKRGMVRVGDHAFRPEEVRRVSFSPTVGPILHVPGAEPMHFSKTQEERIKKLLNIKEV